MEALPYDLFAADCLAQKRFPLTEALLHPLMKAFVSPLSNG